ncbi:MAG: alpha/beta fold hydrolase [Candidatus Obscuribacterales bacterium]|nr:alpha/beta fold hydrolase [Candidatus Obscuribacterales bacterium]
MTEFDNPESESSETIQTTKLEIITDDAIKLGATYFINPKKSAKRAIMIAGATAVPQRFYANFAKYLAAHDCAVLTFDYRGVGDSRPPGGLKNFQATLIDWGQSDTPACLNWLIDRHPDVPLHLVGHSAGGQFIGLWPNFGKLQSAFLVSCSSGYVPGLTHSSKIKALFLFKIYEPVCTLLFGYVPGKKIGLGEDLPVGVVQQWAKWCLNRGYVENSFGKEIASHFYNEVTLPTLVVTPSDDQIATQFNVADFMRLLPHAKIEHLTLQPEKFDLKTIDHLNFFRRQSLILWPFATAWFSKSEDTIDQKPESS